MINKESRAFRAVFKKLRKDFENMITFSKLSENK